MRASSRLIRKIVRAQRQLKLIPEGCNILVALSGGADSVALTIALIELKHFLKFRNLALAHVNHSLRGEESKRDEDFCIEFAKQLGLEIFIQRLDPSKKRGNTQAWAREERYAFFRELLKAEGFELIATGHHLSDLVETAILWILRGAGREGFLGFEPKEGAVVRPLYFARKGEIYEFLKEKSLCWVEDSSNEKLCYARNRIRKEIMPVFESINPRFEEAFLRLREILASEEEVLKMLSNKLNKEALADAPLAVRRRAIRKMQKGLNFAKVDELVKLLEGGHNGLLKSKRGGLKY
ncbi:MAG: tRNA lysidine(34) synthetase TilS [Aquificaceae bacterium]|nr:tRNA lysidine(34) synthetase TilS [Aquificaceae bacterium]MDW8237793.1 tRNA lysidine(34) synthetase TilS [Aquificaceae bacterium]